MKGSPEAPQCGFSRQVANVLRMNNVDKYTYVDILKNQQVPRASLFRGPRKTTP